MIVRSGFANSGGFSLVELLIVVMMMGIVTMGIYSLYESTQRTATTQDEVVELQQNLRVAMDQIARDIRMAGFMIDGAPLSAASANAVTLRTATPSGKMARVVANFTSSTSADVDVTVANSDMVDLFESGASGDWVRIIRPPDLTEPLVDSFQVASKNRTTRRLTLTNFSAAGTDYQQGDIIVRIKTSGTTLPRTISYALDGTDLERTADDGDEKLASKITGLAFSYLLDSGPETSTPANLAEIKAVRVTLTAQAVTQDAASGAPVTKTRTLTSIIALRNR